MTSPSPTPAAATEDEWEKHPVVADIRKCAQEFHGGFKMLPPTVGHLLDRIARDVEAALLAQSHPRELDAERIARVLYETECDPPLYGLTRDQATRLAQALISELSRTP